MNFLARLEKKRTLWIVIFLCFIFFFLRLPSIIEPHWYGDEGIYEVIGQAMDQGRLLYRDIWDNKPPLLYVVYALAQGDQQIVKILSLLSGMLSVIAFFFLSHLIFKRPRISFGITMLYVLLFGTPLLESNIANAEDFTLFPVILSGLLIYLSTEIKPTNDILHQISRRSFILAGLLLGLAFLFKIVAVFDSAAFIFFLLMMPWQHGGPKKKMYTLFRLFIPFLLGFLLPLFLTMLYFSINHALGDFLQSAFSGNIRYVGWQNNLWGIPQGALMLKSIMLLLSIFTVFLLRKRFTKPTLFITIWLLFSLFDVYFSGRPYTHYSIVILPSLCLFIGLFFLNRRIKMRIGIGGMSIVLLMILSLQFHFDIEKAFFSYQNAFQFVTGKKTSEAYQTFFDQNTPRDYTVASFITTHTTPSENVFLWGDSPQIYALSHKLPPGKYTVAYHVTQNNTVTETEQAVSTAKPKYIIILNESQPLPFAIPLYIMRYTISGATIYERSF